MKFTSSQNLFHFTGLLLLAGALNVQAANAIKLDTASMATNSVNWSGGGGTSGNVLSTQIGEFDATASTTSLANMTLGGNNVILAGLLFDGTMTGPLTIASGSTLTTGHFRH